MGGIYYQLLHVPCKVYTDVHEMWYEYIMHTFIVTNTNNGVYSQYGSFVSPSILKRVKNLFKTT